MNSETLARRARAYIVAMPPAISGQHGHDATFAVAKKLIHDFGMSETEAWPIFVDYNARCQPLGTRMNCATNLRAPAI
jgi:hypothetical protein